jgi:DNA polymerase-3 subunit delta'
MFERIAPEQHDTLDGIPEPAENPVLVGHREAGDALMAAYRAGKLPHALLFVGPQGIGKATLAYHLVNHLLSHVDHVRSPEHLVAPDPTSALFRQIANGAHPSVLHLTRPMNDKTKSYKSAVTVDEIRKVSRFLSLTSHDGGYRVVIVDPADDMNVNAANALLKNLEEPPARTLFILIAHSLGRLLPTIRSRCQIVRLSPLSDDDVLAVLNGFDAGLPAGEAERAALIANAAGSPRTAILLTQYGGLEIADALDQLLREARIPVADAHRLADAVAGRDRTVAFGLLNDHALETLASAASTAAYRGDVERAERFSQAWQDLRIAISEADTYNLDRKQHALNMIFRLHDTLRM